MVGELVSKFGIKEKKSGKIEKINKRLAIVTRNENLLQSFPR